MSGPDYKDIAHKLAVAYAVAAPDHAHRIVEGWRKDGHDEAADLLARELAFWSSVWRRRFADVIEGEE